MSGFCISTGEIHTSNKGIFSLMPNGMRIIMFDTMAYKGLLKCQISFPLFKVSQLYQFQTSGFFIGIGEPYSSKKAVGDNLELSKSSEFPVRSILSSGF